ncbi:hypothetical protein BH09BAC3_BH09BAC3_27480 [soil metagenome]
MRGGTQNGIGAYMKKGFFGYHKGVLRRLVVLVGVVTIIASSISISSGIGRNCFLGAISPNFRAELVKTSKSKLTLAEFYISAYCYGKDVDIESLYCAGEIDFLYGYVDPNSNYCKAQRLCVIQNLVNKNLVKNDDWRINKFYNYNLPPAWNPSIPIAYRRLII